MPTIKPEVPENPDEDNVQRPPGDWQVEPDPAEPPPGDQDGDAIPGAPEDPEPMPYEVPVA